MQHMSSKDAKHKKFLKRDAKLLKVDMKQHLRNTKGRMRHKVTKQTLKANHLFLSFPFLEVITLKH